MLAALQMCIMLSHRVLYYAQQPQQQQQPRNNSNRVTEQPHPAAAAQVVFVSLCLCIYIDGRPSKVCAGVGSVGGQTGIFVCSIQIRNHWLLTRCWDGCCYSQNTHTHHTLTHWTPSKLRQRELETKRPSLLTDRAYLLRRFPMDGLMYVSKHSIPTRSDHPSLLTHHHAD